MVNKQLTNKFMPKKQNHKVVPIGMMGNEPLVLPNYSGVKKYSDERNLFTGASNYLKLDASNDPIITTSNLTIQQGTGSGASPIGAPVLVLDTSNILSGLNFLSPTNGGAFFNFGDTDSSNQGFVGYSHVNDTMTFRTDGVTHLALDASGGLSLNSGATTGQTEELKIYGYKTGDALRNLQIGVGTDTADTASFDGVSNYFFDGNVKTNNTSAVSTHEINLTGTGELAIQGEASMRLATTTGYIKITSPNNGIYHGAYLHLFRDRTQTTAWFEIAPTFTKSYHNLDVVGNVDATGLLKGTSLHVGDAATNYTEINATGNITQTGTANATFENSTTINGTLSTTALSPASITGNTNNWAVNTHSFVRYTANGEYNLTGIVAGNDGQRMTLVNIGANKVTIMAQDANSTAANRFITDTGGDIEITQDGHIEFIYDAQTARWRSKG